MTGNDWRGEYRWFDGSRWSWPAFEFDRISDVKRYSEKKEIGVLIQWADRPSDWPERSIT